MTTLTTCRYCDQSFARLTTHLKSCPERETFVRASREKLQLKKRRVNADLQRAQEQADLQRAQLECFAEAEANRHREELARIEAGRAVSLAVEETKQVGHKCEVLKTLSYDQPLVIDARWGQEVLAKIRPVMKIFRQLICGGKIDSARSLQRWRHNVPREGKHLLHILSGKDIQFAPELAPKDHEEYAVAVAGIRSAFEADSEQDLRAAIDDLD
jgi:hypothetical protein